MTASRKQFSDYADRWVEAVPIHRRILGPTASVVASSERDEELQRQLRIIDEITVKHANTLRALARR